MPLAGLGSPSVRGSRSRVFMINKIGRTRAIGWSGDAPEVRTGVRRYGGAPLRSGTTPVAYSARRGSSPAVSPATRGQGHVPLSSAELLVRLDEGGRVPLRVRLTMALREAVRTGQVRPGSTMTSSRALARDLGLSRGLVVEAYAQLTAEGYLLSRPGAGTVVAPGQPAQSGDRRLRPHRRACLTCGRRHLTCRPSPVVVGRTAVLQLARHLARVRGASTESAPSRARRRTCSTRPPADSSGRRRDGT